MTESFQTAACYKGLWKNKTNGEETNNEQNHQKTKQNYTHAEVLFTYSANTVREVTFVQWLITTAGVASRGRAEHTQQH